MTSELRPSCDSKTRFRKTQKNTFGLMPGPQATCPLATIGKGGCAQVEPGRKIATCYVFNLINIYKGVGPILQHNTDLLMQATKEDRVALLKAEFSRFLKSEKKRSDPQLYYRIHWSGDIFDADYADALSEAMSAFPEITFWNYTRNFPLAPRIANNTPNLMQYLSLDGINYEAGLDAYYEWLATDPPYKNIAICYMSGERDFEKRFVEARARHPKWPEKPPVLRGCPADIKHIKTDGACAKCQMCIRGLPIWFNTK